MKAAFFLSAALLASASGHLLAGGGGFNGALESTQWMNNTELAAATVLQQRTIDALTNKAYNLSQNNLGLNASSLLTQTAKLLGDSAAVGNSSAAVAQRLTQVFGSTKVGGVTPTSVQQYKEWGAISRQSVRNAMQHNGVVIEQSQSEVDKLKQLATAAATNSVDNVSMQKMSTEININVAEQLQKLSQLTATNALVAQAGAEADKAKTDSSERIWQKLRRARAPEHDCSSQAGRAFLMANGYCQ